LDISTLLKFDMLFTKNLLFSSVVYRPTSAPTGRTKSSPHERADEELSGHYGEMLHVSEVRGQIFRTTRSSLNSSRLSLDVI